MEEGVYELAPDVASLEILGLEEPLESGFVALESLLGHSTRGQPLTMRHALADGGCRLTPQAIVEEGAPPCLKKPTLGFEQAFGVLRQFTRSRSAASRAVEHCELCSAGLASRPSPPCRTRHAPDPLRLRRLRLALRRNGKIEVQARLPQFPVSPNFEMTDGQWESLMIPINMAFLFRSSLENRIVALYPSPAGAVESLLPLDAWAEIAERQSGTRIN